MTINDIPAAECVVTRADVARAFRAAGAVPGDTLVFHGSLRSMGHVDGGATAVIGGALDAVAPNGTVAVPTLWYNGKPLERREEDFNPATSPAWNGAFAEAMRTDPRSVRSNHFSHSVSAIGRRAVELTANHGAGRPAPSPWSETGFAEISPWSRFYEWNALYAFIGVDMNVCTMKHWIESRFVVAALEQLPASLRQCFREQLAFERCPGPWSGFDGIRMHRRLDAAGVTHAVPLGGAVLLTLRTRPMVELTGEILRREPEAWFTVPFQDWLKSVSATAAGRSLR